MQIYVPRLHLESPDSKSTHSNDLNITNLRSIEPNAALFDLFTLSPTHEKVPVQSCRYSRSSKTPSQRISL